MWFITSIHNSPKFYTSNKSCIEVPEIEWINELKTDTSSYYSSQPFIKDSMQAISALYKARIKGYKTKAEAKVFAKTLPVGGWKYLQIK
jgi:hypothetical protein